MASLSEKVIVDRVKESSNSTGTGDYSLDGAATGFLAFSAVCQDGDLFDYAVNEIGGPNWETGLGRYNSSTNTITRLEIQASSNNGQLVNWTGVFKVIFISLNAISIRQISDEVLVNSIIFG
jgi:hypothetical protein